MSDLLDKAILVGMGLDKKLKEVLEDLRKEGASETAKEGAPPEGEGEGKGEGGEGLTPKQAVENKIVDEGIGVFKELLSIINSAKAKLEGELAGSSEKVLDKLHAARSEDIDVIKEMARVAREKVDALEKRVGALEAELKKK
ncbi:MAG: accessory factor UbiK family protein [Thermodesulfobacteriota bacterium]